MRESVREWLCLRSHVKDKWGSYRRLAVQGQASSVCGDRRKPVQASMGHFVHRIEHRCRLANCSSPTCVRLRKQCHRGREKKCACGYIRAHVQAHAMHHTVFIYRITNRLHSVCVKSEPYERENPYLGRSLWRDEPHALFKGLQPRRSLSRNCWMRTPQW